MVVKTTQMILQIAFALPLLLAASCGRPEGDRRGMSLEIRGPSDQPPPSETKNAGEKETSLKPPVTPPGGDVAKDKLEKLFDAPDAVDVEQNQEAAAQDPSDGPSNSDTS